MATILWVEGWETGIVSALGSTAGQPGIITSATGTGAYAIDSSLKRSGAYSLKISGTAQEYLSRGIVGTGTTVITERFYIYFTTLPSADTQIWRHPAAAGNMPRFDFIYATSKFQVSFAAAGPQVSGVITTGQWYRIDMKVSVAANPRTIDWYVDGVAMTQSTNAVAASYLTATHFGSYSAVTYDMNFDDIFQRDDSASPGAWPISASDTAVEGLSPSGAGTSNLDTTIEDDGSVDVNDATNPANIELDEVPLGSGTDYIKQVGTGAGIYAAVAFANTTLASVLGASAFLAYRSSGTSANSASAKIYDEDGVETAIWTGDLSETSTYYKCIVLPTPAGGWDAAAVNALEGRVGYASDVTTVPYFYGLMVQVAGVAGGGGVSPTVTTTTPTALTTATGSTATSGGNVTDDGGAEVTDAGVCWSTSEDPTTADSHTHDSTGEGAYGSSITGLTHGTLYHVRAWATNSVDTSYGSDETFTPIMGNKIKGII